MSELHEAEAAYERMAWADAYARYMAADLVAPLAPSELECAASAAHLTGRDLEGDALWQRTVHAYEDSSQAERGALAAWRYAMSLMHRGDMAQAGGWFARATRLVEGLDTAVHGYLAIPTALGALYSGDAETAHTKFQFVLEAGQAFGDVDLRTFGRLGLGRSLLHLGDEDAGLALLDDAMVAVIGGETSPTVSGIIYCAVIESCHVILDLRRAREWTDALERWCEAQPDLVPFRGQCLIHRAQIMTLTGSWQSAMDEAGRARARLAATHDPAIGDAVYEQADLHRLRGDLATAETLYVEAGGHGREPQPGLALVRLAQGQHSAALAALRRALAEDRAPTERARILAPYIETALAVDDLAEASAAATELTEIAGSSRSPFLHALAAGASGGVALADGAAATALNFLRTAWTTWCDLDVVYEAARTRVLIALACRDLGDEDTATMDLRSARQTFAELGAEPDVARVDALLAPSPGDASSPLTGREAQVLQLVAAGKTNRQIAEDLVISEKTVARHIANIFLKISVSSRSAATGYAYQHGLA
jgi:DNA-binding CsgD family transcriptional regulator